MIWWEILSGFLLFYIKLAFFAGGTYFCARIANGGWRGAKGNESSDGSHVIIRVARTAPAIAFVGAWLGGLDQFDEKIQFVPFATACLILIPSTLLTAKIIDARSTKK